MAMARLYAGPNIELTLISLEKKMLLLQANVTNYK